MEKTKKEQAIKKLQAELKEDKRADIQRCVPTPVHVLLPLCLTNTARGGVVPCWHMTSCQPG